MAKALPKHLLKTRQLNVKLVLPVWAWNDAEVKTWHLSPTMSPLSPAPRGLWLQMTGA